MTSRDTTLKGVTLSHCHGGGLRSAITPRRGDGSELSPSLGRATKIGAKKRGRYSTESHARRSRFQANSRAMAKAVR